MSLQERVSRLHEWIYDLLVQCDASANVLQRWKQPDTVNQLATHVALLPRHHSPKLTLKVGMQCDIATQWYVVPLNIDVLFLGGPARDDALVLYPSTSSRPSVFMQRVSTSFLIHALQPGQVWWGVGTSLPGQQDCINRRPAFILQTGAIFRAGAHIFEVQRAPRVRKNNRWHVTPAITCSPPVDSSESPEHVVSALVSSESEECVLKCVAPETSTLMHRTFSMQYNKGGVHFSIGTASSCTIAVPFTDVFCSPTHTLVYASNGYFWLVDNYSTLGTYCQLSPSTAGFELKKHMQPQPMLAAHNGVLVKLTVVVG